MSHKYNPLCIATLGWLYTVFSLEASDNTIKFTSFHKQGISLNEQKTHYLLTRGAVFVPKVFWIIDDIVASAKGRSSTGIQPLFTTQRFPHSYSFWHSSREINRLYVMSCPQRNKLLQGQCGHKGVELLLTILAVVNIHTSNRCRIIKYMVWRNTLLKY